MAPVSDQHHMHRYAFDAIAQPPRIEHHQRGLGGKSNFAASLESWPASRPQRAMDVLDHPAQTALPPLAPKRLQAI